MHPDKLVSRIKAVLNGDTGHFEIQSLAHEYTALLMHIRDRIDQCATLIRAGNDYTAFQVAESSPPLLDTAAKLAFAESNEWLSLCRARNLPWPPPLDPHETDLVSSLYGRQISESHPLYRDYRQAIRERDELRALSILTSIIRINPDDRNARQEFIRLGGKIMESHLPKLETLLNANEFDNAFSLAESLESLRLPSLASSPILERARILREQRDRDNALEEAREYLRQISLLRQANDWRTIIPLLGHIRSLEYHHKLEFDDTTLADLTDHEEHAKHHQDALDRIHQHETQIRHVNEELRAAAAPTGNRPRSTTLFHLNRAITAAEALNTVAAAAPESSPHNNLRPDPALLEAALAYRKALQTQARRRNTFIAVTAAAVLAIATATTVTLRLNTLDEQKRSQATARMDAAPAQNKLRDAEALLANLDPHWDSDPAFAAAKKNLSQWASAKRHVSSALLSDLDSLVALPPNTPPDLIHKALGRLNSLKESLTPDKFPLDILALATPKLTTATTRISSQREKLATDVLPVLTREIADLENNFTVARTLPTASQRLNALASTSALAQKLAQTHFPHRFLLSPEDQRHWQELSASIASVLAQCQFEVNTDNALARTATLNEYFNTLKTLAASIETPPPSFAPILANETALRNPAAHVLHPSIYRLWHYAASAPTDTQPFLPGTTLPGEAAEAGQLVKNKDLENIYISTLTTYPTQRNLPKPSPIYTLGPPHFERRPMGNGHEIINTATIYREDGTTEKRTYSLRQYSTFHASGKSLSPPAITPESSFLLQFSRFYDPSFARISEPLLATIDRVRAANRISPLLKVALHMRLHKIAVTTRPEEWGVAFSPSALRAAQTLPKLVPGSLTLTDWLNPPSRWNDNLPHLFRFYESPHPSYLAEATAWLRVFQRLTNPGFTYAGYITSEKKLHPAPRQKITGYLVGISPNGSIVRIPATDLLPADATAAPAASPTANASAAPTPIPLREPVPFAPHSPLLMLALQPSEAANGVPFPPASIIPAGGWNKWFFQLPPPPPPPPPPPSPPTSPSSPPPPTSSIDN
ncbi:MAG: hypothetical protein LBS59_01465 [Puniceicoccales bacterium]|jgi:hypothetical protein|nr:hypothetical protein [Puniceicoccales bacterium]